VTVDRWPMSLFVGDSVRAQLMRAVFPVIAGTTTVFAALDVADHRFGLTQSPLLTSGIFILAITVVSVTVLRAASGIGGRIDRSDSALKTSNAALERMVHDVATTMGRVVETRDPYTQGHEQRVAALAGLIAREMGMSDDEVDGIEMAGLLHDVGKLGVPAEILTKPGSLSSAEFALIREHPQVGFDILKGIAFPWKIAEAVLQHHERMDGSGYPMGSAGGDILMAARILAVADVVEAMASDRPYRPALGLDLAVKEIAEHPERYDVGVSATCASLYAAGRLAV
jgi:putative nucleotidyltransferase with HDIG domain